MNMQKMTSSKTKTVAFKVLKITALTAALCLVGATAALSWLARDMPDMAASGVIADAHLMADSDETFPKWVLDLGTRLPYVVQKPIAAGIFAWVESSKSVPRTEAHSEDHDNWTLPEEVASAAIAGPSNATSLLFQQNCSKYSMLEELAFVLKAKEGHSMEAALKNLSFTGESAVAAMEWFYIAGGGPGRLVAPAKAGSVPRVTTLQGTVRWEGIKDKVLQSKVNCEGDLRSSWPVEDSLLWLGGEELKPWFEAEDANKESLPESLTLEALGLKGGTLAVGTSQDGKLTLTAEFVVENQHVARNLFTKWQALPYPKDQINDAGWHTKGLRESFSEEVRLKGWTVRVAMQDENEKGKVETRVTVTWTKVRYEPTLAEMQAQWGIKIKAPAPVEMAGPGVR